MKKNKKPVGTKAEFTSVDEFIKPKEEPKVDFVEPDPVSKEEIVKGVVKGVQLHLNVRLTPEVKTDNVITILKNGTEVEIIDPKILEEGSGEKWYKIRVFNVEPNIVGYAMTKYISVV